MAKDKADMRPNSYALCAERVPLLHILSANFAQLIEILRPAFELAESAESNFTYAPDSKLSRSQTHHKSERYRSPKEVLDWLDARQSGLDSFINALPPKQPEIAGDDLENIRQIRAFCVRLVSVGKDVHKSKGTFELAENEIFSLLSKNINHTEKQGGILDILRLVLENEECKSKADLGKIRDTVKVGRSIKDGLLAKAALNLKHERHSTPEPIIHRASAKGHSTQLVLSLTTPSTPLAR